MNHDVQFALLYGKYQYTCDQSVTFSMSKRYEYLQNSDARTRVVYVPYVISPCTSVQSCSDVLNVCS